MNHKKKHSPAKNKGLYGEHLAVRAKLRGAKQESNHTAKDYIENSGDFPDYELADAIEEASNEFRRNFKLRSYKL